MRQIGTLTDGDAAQRFADYLLTRQINCRVDAEDDGYTVWVIEEDQVEQARGELQQFETNPDAEQYAAAGQTARDIRKKTEREHRRHRKRVVDVRSRWARPPMRRAPATFVLIVLSVVLTVASNFGRKVEPVISWLGFAEFSGKDDGGWYLPATADGSEQVAAGELWRVITPILLHGGILHLLFNMYWLYVLGLSFESLRGTPRFVLFVLSVAAVSNLAQFYIGKNAAFLGMSGVDCGLFGYVWIRSRVDSFSGFYMHPQTVFFFLLFLVLCLTGAVGRIANAAHFSGLLLGMGVGYLPRLRGPRR